MKAIFIKTTLLLLIFAQSFFVEAQQIHESSFDVPSNFYVTPTGIATWDFNDSTQYSVIEYLIYLDGWHIDNTDGNYNEYNYNWVEPWLIPNQSYTAGISAIYTDGMSEIVFFEFIYLPSGFFQGVENAHSEEYENNILFSWDPISSKKEEYECIGTNIYKNGELLIYVPIPDTSFIYENPPGGFYTYCLTRVYTEDGGEHSWDSDIEENCIDIGFTEPCNPPNNLIAYLIPNQNTNVLNWSPPAFNKSREFQYYNIYRDGDLLNSSPVLDTFYYDYGVSPNELCYETTAVYSQSGESEPSNTSCIVLIWVTNELNIRTSIYPNPTSLFYTIESDQKMINIKLTNYLGEIVNKWNNVNDFILKSDIENYKNGIYFLEIEYEQGIIKKKLIIQK